ncbi:hypothetical protein EC991_011112 [Linnemannia zychae]|nr:hypothetical protein EC991_011112 [Linnemannia zychae]
MAQSISVQGDSCTSAYGFWADQTMDATTVSSIPKDKNVLLDQACQSQTGDPRAEREQSIMDSNNAAHQAVVLYKGPKNVSLTPNRHMLDWNRWLDDETDHLTGLDRAQGHEMVLYQRESRGKDPSSKFGQHRSILWEEGIRDDDPTPSFKIEELGDDDDEDGGNLADDEVELSDDAPLMDLEEQATDMDLD